MTFLVVLGAMALMYWFGFVHGRERNRELPDLTWAEKEAIADEVLAVRQDRYARSFEIDCPECGMVAGSCCMNLGSAGGPANHTARIDAVK